MKSQTVRLIDVGLLGPFMMAAGFWLMQGKRNYWAGVALIGAGGATIGYNWANFETQRRLQQQTEPQ